MSKKSELEEAWECCDEWRDRAQSSEHNFAIQLDISNKLAEALQTWMMHHGERCRVCMEASQKAIQDHSASVQPGREEK